MHYKHRLDYSSFLFLPGVAWDDGDTSGVAQGGIYLSNNLHSHLARLHHQAGSAKEAAAASVVETKSKESAGASHRERCHAGC